jgi:hypothetical protein
MIEWNLTEGRSKKNTTIFLRGYLAGLLVKDVIQSEVYNELIGLLPAKWGRLQAMESFIGPDAVDMNEFPDDEE